MIDFEDLNPVSSKLPATIASANTIAPKTRFTRLTGTAQIQNIIPPIEEYHELAFMPEENYAGVSIFIIGGNIEFSTDPPPQIGATINDHCVLRMFYDPRFRKYYIATTVVTNA